MSILKIEKEFIIKNINELYNEKLKNKINISISNTHGKYYNNNYIKLKKNQSVIINYFSNIYTRDLYITINQWEEYIKTNTQNCVNNYNDCLNNLVQNLNKIDNQNLYGLYIGNEIDYKKDLLYSHNVHINYVPNISLSFDNDLKNNYFYDYTQDKKFYYNIQNDQQNEQRNIKYYICDLVDLINNYYEDNEFILIVTACINSNNYNTSKIQIGLLINNKFNIYKYLISKKEKNIMSKNKSKL